MRGITKTFPGTIANKDINFDLKPGEVHALLGENGAGKTTLMKILYGLYQSDEGEILIRGEKTIINSPKEALKLGVGMVHQHFMLIPTLTVTENVALGKPPEGLLLNLNSTSNLLSELSSENGLSISPKAKVKNLSVGEQQRVEIIKTLYWGAEILILDEPTAMLTPKEAKELMNFVRKSVREKGMSVIFITHKLREVLEISDRITILRKGKVVDCVKTKNVGEKKLAKAMVGRDVLFKVKRKKIEKGKTVLTVQNLQARGDEGFLKLSGVSFDLKEKEILGIAGVSGNGQKELAEVITGLRKAEKGKVVFLNNDITALSPKEIKELGIGYIPEDRIKVGIVNEIPVCDNLFLKHQNEANFRMSFNIPFLRNFNCFLNDEKIRDYAKRLIKEYNIKVSTEKDLAKSCSGGNLQKILIARELYKNPKLLVACYPTRGLDVGSIEQIRELLKKEVEAGSSIILISESLEELKLMSDRIAIIYEGRIRDIVPSSAKKEEIGLIMGGN